MKTLDEVIKAMEICTSDEGGCGGCPYDIDCKPDRNMDDVLHYLREYRDKRDLILSLEKRMAKYDKLLDAVEEFMKEVKNEDVG